jgi:hypothetical protein
MGLESLFEHTNAMTVPANSKEVEVHDALTVLLSGSGSITHVIDDTGNSVSCGNGGPSQVTLFPDSNQDHLRSKKGRPLNPVALPLRVLSDERRSSVNSKSA